jgi:ribosomal protein S18 acetylase RimI-like enzyme
MTINVQLVCATEGTLADLLPLVAAYHDFEDIDHAASDIDTVSVLRPLVGDSPHGAVWFIEKDGQNVGYIAICDSYSIEFGGKTAMIDEFFIVPAARGQGIGRRVLGLLEPLLITRNINVLFLEVSPSNTSAQRLYQQAGFTAYDKYLGMAKRLQP